MSAQIPKKLTRKKKMSDADFRREIGFLHSLRTNPNDCRTAISLVVKNWKSKFSKPTRAYWEQQGYFQDFINVINKPEIFPDFHRRQPVRDIERISEES